MAALIMSLITNSIVTETHPAGGHDHAKYGRDHERERERERSVGMTATVSEKVTYHDHELNHKCNRGQEIQLSRKYASRS